MSPLPTGQSISRLLPHASLTSKRSLVLSLATVDWNQPLTKQGLTLLFDILTTDRRVGSASFTLPGTLTVPRLNSSWQMWANNPRPVTHLNFHYQLTYLYTISPGFYHPREGIITSPADEAWWQPYRSPRCNQGHHIVALAVAPTDF
jgi:hypothetical protein